ncbi:helix-turn-helix domain-containing protein [Nocardioides sp. Bht2]
MRDFREWVLWSVGVSIEVPDDPAVPERERLRRAIGPDRARRVLTALAAHADNDGRAFPSVGTLVELTRLSRWTVRDALAYLAAAGVIAQAGTRGRGVVVWLLSPGGDARHGGDPRQVAETGSLLAGNLAGDLAGDQAGVPDAEQGQEPERITTGSTQAPTVRPHPPHSARLAAVAALLSAADRDDLDPGLVWHGLTTHGDVKHPDLYLAALGEHGQLRGYLNSHEHLLDGGTP